MLSILPTTEGMPPRREAIGGLPSFTAVCSTMAQQTLIVPMTSCEQSQMQCSKHYVQCEQKHTVLSNHACRSEPADDQNNKRKRFSDEQLLALTDLADEANWSLLSVAKEVREQFCSKYEISKVCSGIAYVPAWHICAFS